MICGTLLAAYMQEWSTAWYLKCNVYLLIKKPHLVSWRGCPTFGVQFRVCSGFQTTFGFGRTLFRYRFTDELFRIGECVFHFGELYFAA